MARKGSTKTTNAGGEESPEPSGKAVDSFTETRLADAPAADYAATMDFAESNDDDVSPAIGKQDRDLAFAAAMLRSGKASDRQLARTTANWTIHGHESLAERLVCEGLITEAERHELEVEARREVESLHAELSDSTLSATRIEQTKIARLDPSGRLCKLLGMSAAAGQLEDQEERRTDARYTLIRKLGQGGLGTVWLARDQNLRRFVAVKEITRHSTADDAALARFRREAEITGRLEHPGIVPVYQLGTDPESKRIFYAMRFLGKRTLQDAIAEYHERRESGDDDPMLLHQLLTVFVNVCQAVAHAHSRKIIHRDLKPENVALDSFGQVVLLDWGLAKVNDETGVYEIGGEVEPGDVHDSGMTRAGQVLGTPMYMAPEQASGRLDEIDERTDVYGLGGVLYAILTGLAPHDASYVSRDGRSKVSHLFSAIVSEPTAPPREIVPSVPRQLDAICTKALSKKRYLRYDSASDLAEDVQRYMAGATVSAYHEPPAEAAKRWVRNHPRMSQAIFFLSAAALVTIAALGVTARQAALSAHDARYDALKELVHELEINLKSDAKELGEDVQFLTELPPIQQIAAAQTGESLSGEEDEVWRERLGTIFDGLLRANSTYLLANYARIEGGVVTELVRSNRNSASDRVRRTPASRLAQFQAGPQIEQWKLLRPGDVFLTTTDKIGEDAPTQNRRPLVVIAGSPVFDDRTGALFGFTVVEIDLADALRSLLEAIVPHDVEVYVTNDSGQIALHADEESVVYYGDDHKSVASLLPTIASFFDPKSELDEFADGNRIFAHRLRLGPAGSTATICIIAVMTN